MQIKMIDGVTKVFGAPGDWDPSDAKCMGLPVKEVETDNGMFYVSAWEPTPDEISQLLKGETIKLWIRGPSHPVVALTVGPIE